MVRPECICQHDAIEKQGPDQSAQGTDQECEHKPFYQIIQIALHIFEEAHRLLIQTVLPSVMQLQNDLSVH